MKTQSDRTLTSYASHGLREVSQAEFYASMSLRRSVDYSTVSCYERQGRGYVTEFTVNRQLIAVRESGDFPFTASRYFLSRSA